MKNMLRAVVVAVLFASGAQAATVDGLFDLSGGIVTDPQPGQMLALRVTLDQAALGALPDGKTQSNILGSELYFYISGQGITAGPGIGGEPTVGQVYGSGLSYLLPWIWQTGGGTDFQFQGGYLKRFYSPQDTGPIVRNGTTGLFEGTFYGEKIGSPNPVGRLAVATATPVPIGGTLPLMLSALGLGAFVMRWRAKKAVLA